MPKRYHDPPMLPDHNPIIIATENISARVLPIISRNVPINDDYAQEYVDEYYDYAQTDGEEQGVINGGINL